MSINWDTYSARSSGSGKQYVHATYLIEAEDITAATTALIRGQTIGNPTIPALLEDPGLVNRHIGVVEEALPTTAGETYWIVKVKFPAQNFGREGLNYLMSVLIGGQCDIDIIRQCRLIDVDLSALPYLQYSQPYGIQRIREVLKKPSGPLLCAIIKPKIGLSPRSLSNLVREMADAGVDIIKEDEILASQKFCSHRERIPLIAEILKGYNTMYLPCITGDGNQVLKRARFLLDYGIQSAHINIWCSLGTYRDIKLHTGMILLCQKSGDKVWTTGSFSVDFKVICKVVSLIGIDMIHVGMYGGYLSEPIEELQQRISVLRPTVPSFSCGMTPERAVKIVELFGEDLMITSGGYVCGHPKGAGAGIKEFKDALSC